MIDKLAIFVLYLKKFYRRINMISLSAKPNNLFINIISFINILFFVIIEINKVYSCFAKKHLIV